MDFLPKNINAYAEALTSPESPLLQKINRETHVLVMRPRMLSGHLQGRFLSLWSNAVAGSPLKGRSWDNLGVCQFQEGNVEEAIISLRKSLEVDPGHVESYQKLGMILSLQNRYQESLAVTEEGLKRAPENADLCYNKGAAFANTGRLNEAKEWLLRAIQLRSNYGFAHFSLGSLYAALRDYERALNHLRMAESLMPGDPRITAAISQLPVTTDNTGG